MHVRQEARYRRRRAVIGGVAALALAGSLTACLSLGGDEEAADQVPGAASPAQDDDAADTTGTVQEGFAGVAGGGADEDAATETPEGPVAGPPPIPSDESFMERVDYITGTAENPIPPKSVVASGAGLVVANNMMYSHTSTFYDAVSREVVATLSDEIVPEEFGIEGHPGPAKGSPVEAAWTD